MNETAEKARKWVKANSGNIVETLCAAAESVDTKPAIFMAGSPGAGKTETARRLIKRFHEGSLVHIDQDVIKSLVPGYVGSDAEKYHGAASLGVEKVLDYVLKKGYGFVLDSTLSDVEKAKDNISRSLKKNYAVKIYFVYQEPQNAWGFVKRREQVEGRVVPKESFVRQFVKSRSAVNEIKQTFGKKVNLNFVLKTVDTGGIVKEEFRFNVESVDGYIKKAYGKIYTDGGEILRTIV